MLLGVREALRHSKAKGYCMNTSQECQMLLKSFDRAPKVVYPKEIRNKPGRESYGLRSYIRMMHILLGTTRLKYEEKKSF